MTPDHGNSAFGAGGRFGPPAPAEPEPVIVRDKRRVNAFGTAPPAAPVADQAPVDDLPPAPSPEVAALTAQLAERTADLQRLKAEYDNYRRRVDRDRQAGADQATAKVLGALLATLDDIALAREHGDLEGLFRTVGESLESTLASVGLERYGVVGETFDPQVHEALVHTFQPGLDGPTCVEIYRSGYRFAGRVLRPAQVVVADPSAPEESPDGAA